MDFQQQLDRAIHEQQAFLVRGATGSGKTWFVSKVVELLGDDVVSVPQYPMFKPQLRVSTFINMLPLPRLIKTKLFADLERMGVPTDRLVGGKLMGMMDVPGLSGGQRKKLLLALAVQTALVRRARAVVLDEPFAGVDAQSMPHVLDVLKEVQEFHGMKILLVTHDHFALIDDAFPGTTHLKVDSRRVFVDDDPDVSDDTLTAARVVVAALESIKTETLVNISSKVTHSDAARWLDLYLIKRHFIEGEHVLPLMICVIFSFLTGLAVTQYKGHGDGVVPLSSSYTFLKIFIMEYQHFGSIINYCFKRAQHLEDVNLLLTRQRDSIVEMVIIAILQSTVLVLVMDGILVAMAPRFWWINWDVILVDICYGIMSTVGYYTIPIVQSNPLIVMASIFPYVATWGSFNGVLLPREYAAPGSRFLTFFSSVYHYSCAVDGAAGDELQLRGTNCKHVAIHVACICPLFHFAILAVIVLMAFRRSRAEQDRAIVAVLSKRNLNVDITVDDDDEDHVSRSSISSSTGAP